MVKPAGIRAATTCPYCYVKLSAVNLLKHCKRVHGLAKKPHPFSSDLFKSYQLVKPTPSPEASLKLAQEPNAAFKREVAERRDRLKRSPDPYKKPEKTIKTTHCPICGIVIADHLLRKHEMEVHEWKPKKGVSVPTRRPKKSLISLPPAVEPLKSSREVSAVSLKGRQAICPRCSGDGGVRGGCGKCDGTGWVPEEMERDVFFSYKQRGGDESKVSNSDYAGNNLGGHFRDHDGRIGSIPLHDDYSEESE